MRHDFACATAIVAALACSEVVDRQPAVDQQSASATAAAIALDPQPQHPESVVTLVHDTFWVEYEPKVVQLTGAIDTLVRAGAPNYGESPAMDQRVVVPVLRLDNPISVRADPQSETNDESVLGATVIQLLLPSGGMVLPAVGTRASISGTLSHAISGHHYTALLLSAARLQEAE